MCKSLFQYSIVTMSLSHTVAELYLVSFLSYLTLNYTMTWKSRFIPAFDYPIRGLPVGILQCCLLRRPIETRMAWLPDGEKNKICLAVSTCDRQTDGQIDILRLAVSAVLQCGLASGCELVKRRSAPTYTMRA